MVFRWTFSMQFWFNRYNPFRFIWDPRLVFTGTTILGVDPESGGPMQLCQACREVLPAAPPPAHSFRPAAVHAHWGSGDGGICQVCISAAP